MTQKTKVKFDTWYEENKNTPFNLSESLASYCLNDVFILLHAVLKLRQLFLETTGVDILLCNTIASGCLKAFQHNSLPNSKTLALVGEKGYGRDKLFKQSDLARKYLAWLSHIRGVPIQDCESPEYEKKIGDYRVDGFIPKEDRPEGEQEKDLVIEIHG
jgi:hypothetical protein